MPQNRVSAEFILPCGCAITKFVVLEVGEEADDRACRPATFRSQLDSASEMLADWFDSRCERHKCDLVNDDNPHGLARSQ